jgi:hypothetical protein
MSRDRCWPDPKGIARREMERGLTALREAALRREIEDEIDRDLRRGIRALGAGVGAAEADVGAASTFAAVASGGGPQTGGETQ